MARIRSLRGKTITAHLSITEESWRKLQAQLKRLESVARKDVMEKAVTAGAEVIRDEANVLAPGPHIELSVPTVTNTNAIAHVGPDAEHWQYRFMELGATPHEITGAPLVFWGDDGLVVTRSVSHPGMIAEPFLRPAAEEKSQQAQEAMAAVLESEMRKAV